LLEQGSTQQEVQWLFPKPLNIKYERDGVKFIGMMAIVGVIGFTFSIVISIYECL